MKYVVITGGASGMGRATALKLANNGYFVFSCDIKVNSEENPNIRQLIVDVTDIKSVERAYAEIFKVTSRLDAVINFAGIIMMNSLVEISEEDFVKIFNIFEVSL